LMCSPKRRWSRYVSGQPSAGHWMGPLTSERMAIIGMPVGGREAERVKDVSFKVAISGWRHSHMTEGTSGADDELQRPGREMLTIDGAWILDAMVAGTVHLH
jgi:hypothetical protein